MKDWHRDISWMLGYWCCRTGPEHALSLAAPKCNQIALKGKSLIRSSWNHHILYFHQVNEQHISSLLMFLAELEDVFSILYQSTDHRNLGSPSPGCEGNPWVHCVHSCSNTHVFQPFFTPSSISTHQGLSCFSVKWSRNSSKLMADLKGSFLWGIRLHPATRKCAGSPSLPPARGVLGHLSLLLRRCHRLWGPGLAPFFLPLHMVKRTDWDLETGNVSSSRCCDIREQAAGDVAWPVPRRGFSCPFRSLHQRFCCSDQNLRNECT